MGIAIHEIAKTPKRMPQAHCRSSHIAQGCEGHLMHTGKPPATNEPANESPMNRHAPLPHGDNLPWMRSVIAPLEEHVIQTSTQQATHKRIKCEIDHPFGGQMTAFGFQAEQPYTHQQRGHIHQAIETQRKWTNPEHNWMHSALQPPREACLSLHDSIHVLCTTRPALPIFQPPLQVLDKSGYHSLLIHG